MWMTFDCGFARVSHEEQSLFIDHPAIHELYMEQPVWPNNNLMFIIKF